MKSTFTYVAAIGITATLAAAGDAAGPVEARRFRDTR